MILSEFVSVENDMEDQQYRSSEKDGSHGRSGTDAKDIT
jgi:hypothetical protein